MRGQRLAVLLGLGLALWGLAAWPVTARGQAAPASPAPTSEAVPGLLVWRNQFEGLPQRPERDLPPGQTVTVRAERWRVNGVTRLRVVSPDPRVAAVLRPVPEPARSTTAGVEDRTAAGGSSETPALRMYVIVIVRPSVPSFELEAHGHLLQGRALVPQPHYPLGHGGVETALAGAPGRVRQIVIQDNADAEFRLHQTGDTLELQVVPPDYGGEPSGMGPPSFLPRPLHFTDGPALLAAYTGRGLATLTVRNRFVLRLNERSASGTSTKVARVLATVQVWRSSYWALWLEGGAGYLSQSGSSSNLHLAGGATLHWRFHDWGAELNAGRVGSDTVLELLGGWQVWRYVGLVVGWQDLPGGSGTVLGASVGF